MDIKREPEEMLLETDDKFFNLNIEQVEQNLENVLDMERKNSVLKEAAERTCANKEVIKKEIDDEWQEYNNGSDYYGNTKLECFHNTSESEIIEEDKQSNDTAQPKIKQETDPDGANSLITETVTGEDNSDAILDIECSKDDSKNQQKTELFPCDHCNKTFKRLYTLKKHKSIHTKEKLFACDVCDFKCRFARNLPQHKLTHTQDRPFACDKCNYTTKHAIVLRQHMLVHSDEKPYSCNLCSFRCKRRSFLTLHKFKHSNTEQLRYCCTHCEFQCRYTKELIAHEISHTNDGRFACEKCFVGFNVYNELVIHRNEMHDEK